MNLRVLCYRPNPNTHCNALLLLPVRPEDESGFGAGLWTLAARLIEFTDSEREEEEEEGHFRSIASPVRPSVYPIESPGRSMEKKAISIQVACALLFSLLLRPFSLFLLISRMIQVAMPFLSSGDIEFRHYLGLGTGTKQS